VRELITKAASSLQQVDDECAVFRIVSFPWRGSRHGLYRLPDSQ
jgi:hypothetical protein